MAEVCQQLQVFSNDSVTKTLVHHSGSKAGSDGGTTGRADLSKKGGGTGGGGGTSGKGNID